ncbi:MAG: RluA family pseudouridine synthase, partial [Chloroflexota bacterium]|nr:RluA family pseudouridine synthase [Chloroflexota bacterium]
MPDRPAPEGPAGARRAPARLPLKPRHIVREGGAEQFDVPAYASRQRIDAFLSKYAPDRSRSEWQRLIDAGAVTLDGRIARPSDRIETGQRIRVEPVASHVTLRPTKIPLAIVYEDPQMIVVNKPPGLVVHPAPGHEEGTLVHALLARYPELRDPTGEQRPGIVHRLDKDTSGLIVIGRTTAAMAHLQAQFRERTAGKRYLLLLLGNLSDEEAAIEAPIGRDRRDRKRMSAQVGGRESRTQFRVLERYGRYTLVDADLQSGRTHQLRVHFQFINHPVAGDRTYGPGTRPPGLRRQFVHAAYLAIRSPHDGVEREFYAPLPPDLLAPIERLRALAGLPSPGGDPLLSSGEISSAAIIAPMPPTPVAASDDTATDGGDGPRRAGGRGPAGAQGSPGYRGGARAGRPNALGGQPAAS